MIKEDQPDSFPTVDPTNWRHDLCDSPKRKKTYKLQRFTDDRKGVYLQFLEQHGQVMLAIKAADIAPVTLYRHLEDDLEFAAAQEEVMKMRSTRIVQRLEKEAIEGHTSLHYDKDGNLIQEKRVFETPLRLAMLKRHGEGYQDKAQIDFTTKGEPVGAIAVPTGLTVEQWKEKYEKQQRGDS